MKFKKRAFPENKRNFQQVMRLLNVTNFALTLIVGCYGCAKAQGEAVSTQAPAKSLSQAEKASFEDDTVRLLPEFRPDTVLQPGKGAVTLAATLAQTSGRSALVILPQEDEFALAAERSVPDGRVQWKNLQSVLRQSGAVNIVFDGSKTICVVQGRAYPEDKPQSNCYNSKLWSEFWPAYRKLSIEEQESLLSKAGLTTPSDLGKLPEGLRQMVATSQFQFTPSDKSGRMRFRLVPVINAAFHNSPPSRVSGWWHWSARYTIDSLLFPDVLLFPQMQGDKWRSSLLDLGSGAVLPERVTSELARVTGAQVKVSEGVKWPVIGVEGNKIRAGELLQCLETAGVVESRYFEEQKVLYLAVPNNKSRIIRPLAVPKEEYSEYLRLLL